MKAKDYAQHIKDSGFSTQAIQETVTLLVKEISEIAIQRNCKTNDAVNAVFKEIDDKYKAMCRIVNKDGPMLLENGFKGVMIDAFKDNPEVMKLDYFKAVKP